jgi:uncharacterized protein (TIGR04255 family)
MQTKNKMKYRNNFLTNVICRFDFRPIPEIDRSFLNKFRTEIKGEFPKIKEGEIKGFEAKIGEGIERPEMAEIPAIPVFKYTDTDEENWITLASNHLVIESRNYIIFKPFRKIIELALETLTGLNVNPDYTRLGLRYKNQIVLKRGNPLSWGRYIDSSFLSVVDRFFEKSPDIARMMGQVILKHDDYKINFNYGMHNSEFPARISRKEFILDFDFYTEYVEPDQILPLIKKFNKESAIMFERCIRDGLRSHMEVIDE